MPWETFPIECGGGLITNLPPVQQGIEAPGSAIQLLNFEASIDGGYSRINGYTKWDEDPVPEAADGQILGVKFFDGEVVAVREDAIYSSEGDGWTELIDGRTHTTKHRFTIFNFDGTRKLLGVDGDNFPYTYDKSTLVESAAAEIEGAAFAVAFKDHMFYAVDDLLVFSEPFSHDDFDPGDGAGNIRLPGTITGLIVFREQLFIFTGSTISQLSGTSAASFALSSLAEDIGCEHPDTIQEVAGDIIFLSTDGLRLLSATERIGDFNNLSVSKAIQTNMTAFHREYNDFCSLVIRGKSQYRIMGWSAPQSRQSVKGFIGVQFEAQNPNSFSWSETLGIKAYSADSAVWNNQEYVIFSSDTGYVYRLDVGADFDGVAIESSYWTPYLSITDPRIRKTLYKMHLYLTPTNVVSGVLNIKFNLGESSAIQPAPITFDLGGEVATWNTVNWNQFQWASASDTRLSTQVVGSGFLASLQFRFFDVSDRFSIDTIILEFAQEGRS